MKIKFFFTSTFLAIWGVAACAQLRKGDLVDVCGDSITEQRLYSVMMETYLIACAPVEDVGLIQFGWSGERIWGLNARYNNVIAPFGATVATTSYGMNDGSYFPVDPGLLQNYSNHLVQVVGKMRDSGTRFIVLGSPSYIDAAAVGENNRLVGRGPDAATSVEYNVTLGALGDTARQAAGELGTGFADVHGTMSNAVLAARSKLGADYTFSTDGVHPFANGQIIMAYAYLKAFGCDGDIGIISVDWKTGTASTGSRGHRVLGMAEGVVKIESTRYPFYLEAGEKSPREMSEFFPFNEDLNRYMLIVHGAPAKTRVAWGEDSGEFTAQELEAGINLAAEFPENPFKEPFLAVKKAVQSKQEFETIASKGAIETLPNWKKVLPEKDAELESIRRALMDKMGNLREEAQAKVVPVVHEIKLSPVH